MTRLEALIKIGLILLVALGALVFALWTRSEFVVVSLGNDFCVRVDEGECEKSSEGIWRGKVKHGEHVVFVERENYVDWISKVEVGRWKNLELAPVWNWAPVLSFENWEGWWRISDEVKEEIFQDDQWEVLSEMCGQKNERPEEAKLLGGLPEGISEMRWHESGKWAVGKFENLLRSRWFIYDTESGEAKKLDARVLEVVPLGESEDEFLYLWDDEGETELAISNRKTGEFGLTTDLPGVTDGVFFVSPDGQKIVFQNLSEGNNQDFYLVRREEGRRDKITAGNDAVFVLWAGDSEKILLWQRNDDGSLRMGIWDAQKNEKEELDFVADFGRVVWKAGSEGLMWFDENGILNEWDLEGGRREMAVLEDEIWEGILGSCADEKSVWFWKGEGEVLRVKFAE